MTLPMHTITPLIGSGESVKRGGLTIHNRVIDIIDPWRGADIPTVGDWPSGLTCHCGRGFNTTFSLQTHYETH